MSNYDSIGQWLSNDITQPLAPDRGVVKRMTIQIARSSLEKAIEAVKRLNEVALQKGLPSMSWQYSHKILKSEDGQRAFPVTSFEVINPLTDLGDYRVVAKLDFSSDKDLYLKDKSLSFFPYLYMQSGALKDLPQSLLDGKCPPNCDHCEIARFRNLTWVLQHKETNEFKQVGSSCIEEYTAADNVQDALKWLDLSDKLFRILEGMRINEEEDQLEKLFGDDMQNSGGKNIFFTPSHVLAVALSIVDSHGYVSREKAEICGISSTADAVKNKVYKISESQLTAYLPKAKSIIDFVHSDNFPEKLRNTEYGFNLKSVTATYVDLYKFGLIVSAVQVYENWLKAETSVKHTKNSKHQGSSGDKINRELTLYHSFPLFSKWGAADALLFHDNEGNVYRWDTAARPRGLIKNTPFDATMTIKGLSEYQGTKQTLVTRIKFPVLDAVFALAETAKDLKKFSKLLGSIKHNLIYFDGKGKTFWLNQRASKLIANAGNPNSFKSPNYQALLARNLRAIS